MNDEVIEPADAEELITSEDELFEESPAELDQFQLLQLEIARLARERDEAKNDALRSLADMQNFRKMSEVRLQQDRKFATEKLVRDLLPVLDNFDRALAHFNSPAADVTTLVDGIVAIQKQLQQALEGQGVKRINAVGEAFDPEHHEALVTAQSDLESGTVIEELETGYLLHDRVIRPARVKVAA
jgi:molecular chaperone GrpE